MEDRTTQTDTPPILRRLVSLARWRRLILANTLLVAAGAVVVSLLLPKTFRATASVFPPEEDVLSARSLTTMMAAGGLAPTRQSLPLLATPSDIYAAILKSRSVREEIIRRYDLMSAFGVRTMDEALDMLRSMAKVKVGTEGIVSVTVVDEDPEKAARIANDFVSLLDVRARERRRASAGAVRVFLDTRVAECRDSLAAAEHALQRVQEETGILAPGDQVRSLVDAAVQLDLSRRVREVELGILRAQVGPDDPDRARLAREVGLYESQLRDIDKGKSADSAAYQVPLRELPARTADYARAMRQVKLQEALFEILNEQLEQYRILELRDTPSVQSLDKAVAAQKRWRPVRWLICAIATGLAFLFSCLLAWGLDGLERMRREQPERYRVLAAAGRALTPRNWFSSGPDLPAP
jgi:tyrosine-protein kinase Etk/Wzc